MSVAEIWDRLWWSMVITVLIGLAWLIFIDPVFPIIAVGMAVSLGLGGTYFVVGIVRMAKQKRLEKSLEEKAYRELMQELGAEVRHD